MRIRIVSAVRKLVNNAIGRAENVQIATRPLLGRFVHDELKLLALTLIINLAFF